MLLHSLIFLVLICLKINIADADAVCGLMAATNIHSITNFSAWSCTTAGAAATNPCSPVWFGLGCSGGNIVSINIASLPISGISEYRKHLVFQQKCD